METRWIAEIQSAPTPDEGSLTERALTQTTPVKRASPLPYALGGLSLALAAPVALIFLPKKSAPMPKTVKLVFVQATPNRANAVSLPAILTPTPGIKILNRRKTNVINENLSSTTANRISTGAKAISEMRKEQVALQSEDHTFSSRPRFPAVEQSIFEKPVALALLQDRLPALEVKALANPPVRSLSTLSVALTHADADPRLERRLRFPLNPLPKVPQATVQKAELSLHADSGHVAGSVALAPEEAPRELLVAVFDRYGALIATTKTLVPAKAETVQIEPFVAPKASRYQLGLRPRFERDKSKEMIVGGYAGHEKHAEVPAPPGVTLGDADFYQSNVYRDHFVRFSATLSQKLLKQPLGEPSLTLHGTVVDDKGALLSVASEPIASKSEAQRLDLDFGLLPEVGGYKYSFVVTSQYGLTYAPDASFTASSAKVQPDGSMILAPKLREFPMAEILKKPELQDYIQVKLTPQVVAALKTSGVTEFVGRVVEASGKIEKTLYTGFPSVEVTTVTVEKLEDITIAPKQGNLP